MPYLVIFSSRQLTPEGQPVEHIFRIEAKQLLTLWNYVSGSWIWNVSRIIPGSLANYPKCYPT